MKVLIISPGSGPIPVTKGGAVESLIEYLARENENEGKFDLSITSFYDDKAVEKSKEFLHSNFYFIKIPKFVILLDKIVCFIATKILRQKKVMRFSLIFQRLFYISKVKKILKKHNFDKVILENHIFLLKIFKNKSLYNKYLGRYYYHEHNVFNRTLGCNKVLLSCEKIITVSDYISKEFSNFFPLYRREKIQKLPNVSDLDRFRNPKNIGSFKEKFGITQNDFIVLFAGRIDPTKGVLEVLGAFEKINHSNAKLMIVGSYNYGSGQHSSFEKELHKRAEKLKGRIIFTGFVSFYDMPAIYKLANIIVLPSIWDDPAPLSIIEALSSGKALITTYSGGIPEYAEGVAVLLSRDDKIIDNLAKAINSFISDPMLITKYEDLAIEHTKTWTIKKYYNDFYSLIS